MRTIETTIYEYSELSEKAKENVKTILMSEYFWANEAIESLRAFASEIDISLSDYEIDWSNSCSRSYVKWIGTPHSRFIKQDLTGVFSDHGLTSTWNKTRDVDECINAWLKDCWADYEHQQSEEYVLEHCNANHYEFTEEGKLV
jgi:hypothetical protein